MTAQRKLYLVTGGSGSGKSEFAQQLAASLGQPVTYLATGKLEGAEMAWRIQRHRDSRPASWTTVEAPRNLTAALEQARDAAPVVLLEDVGSLAAACLPHVDEHDGELALPHSAIEEALGNLTGEIDGVARWCQESGKSLVVVTVEVGLGMLPMSPVSRLYKDVIGQANQHLAGLASTTFLVVSGIPVDISALKHATLKAHGLA